MITFNVYEDKKLVIITTTGVKNPGGVTEMYVNKSGYVIDQNDSQICENFEPVGNTLLYSFWNGKTLTDNVRDTAKELKKHVKDKYSFNIHYRVIKRD
jgi:hypothetical protein